MNFNDPETVVPKQKRKINPFLWYLLLGLLIGVTGMTGIFAGAVISCGNGGGSLDGFTCYEPVVVGACEDIAGQLYKVPEEAYDVGNSPAGG